MPPPRLHACLCRLKIQRLSSTTCPNYLQSRHASTAAIPAVDTTAPPLDALTQAFHPDQPPSQKRPEFRKTQLLRQYASLIQSSPLILFFQHNNLFASEWMALRRELSRALRNADEQLASTNPSHIPVASNIKLQVVQGNIFNAALNILESTRPLPPSSENSTTVHTTHHNVLSPAAHRASLARRTKSSSSSFLPVHGLEPLLTGPLALLTFPTLSPSHLASALRILSPSSSPPFDAPKRRAQPSYHEPTTQSALQKILLLGGRAEGKRVLADEDVRWVGGLEGGLDGLRAQLVSMLSVAGGAGLAGLLEGAGRTVYFTLEGRRVALEEQAGKSEV